MAGTFIKHIVMWNVAGDSAAERRTAVERVKAAFEGLRGRIPGLRSIEVGIDFSREAESSDVVLFSEFDSEAALRAYSDHPEHLRVRRELAGLRRDRRQVDYGVGRADEGMLL